MEFKYEVDGYDGEITCPAGWEDHEDWIAEKAAEDFYNDSDGWEDSWPLIFTIFTKDGKELGKFSVHLEFDPVFFPRKRN